MLEKVIIFTQIIEIHYSSLVYRSNSQGFSSHATPNCLSSLEQKKKHKKGQYAIHKTLLIVFLAFGCFQCIRYIFLSHSRTHNDHLSRSYDR